MTATEGRHPGSGGLDRRPAPEIIRLMHEEDRRATEAVGAVLDRVAAAAEAAAESLAAGGRLIYVGAGTSGRLGVLDAVECGPTFGAGPDRVVAVLAGGEAALTRAVEGAEDDPAAGARAMAALAVGPRDTVVGLAAGGRTPFTVGALAAARAAGAATVAVTSVPGSPLAREAAIAIVPETGPEVLAGSTRLKAGTAQKLILNMISTAAFTRLGRIYDNLMAGMRPANAKLAARAVRIVAGVAGTDLERARRALAGSGGEVDAACVMLLAGVPAEEARRLLRASGGHVRRAAEMGRGLGGDGR